MSFEQFTETHNQPIDYEVLLADGAWRFHNNEKAQSLSPEQKKEILDFYTNNFEYYSGSEQVQILEQFILHGIVQEEQVIDILLKMKAENWEPVEENAGFHEYIEQYQQIMNLILKVLPPHSYDKAFYICYDTVRRIEDKVPTKKEYLFIPFRHFSNDDNSFVQYKESIDVIIAFLKAKQKYNLTEIDYSSDVVTVLKSKKYYVRIFPLLTPLLEAGEITEEEVKEILMFGVTDEDDEIYDAGNYYFGEALTDEEKQKSEQIQNNAFEINPELEKLDYQYQLDWPAGLREEYNKLKFSAENRFIQYFFQNFNKVFSILSSTERSRFIKSLLNDGFPILIVIDQLQLNEDELKIIFEDTEYLQNMLTDDIGLSNHAVLNKLIDIGETKAVVNALKEFFYHSIYHDYYIVLSSFKSVYNKLSTEERNEIIDSINEIYPDVWLHDMEFAINNNIIDVEKYIIDLMDKPSVLISNYSLLAMCVNKYSNQIQSENLNPEIFSQRVKDNIWAQPEIAIKHPNSIFNNLSTNEVAQYLEENIESQSFLLVILNNYDKFANIIETP